MGNSAEKHIRNTLKVRSARDYAVYLHRSTNHLYDDEPYERHIEMVVFFATKYIHLISGVEENVIAAAWLHDTIEDCRVTYNDLLQRFGKVVAELVYAVTNEKGRTRKDRANEKYYREMQLVDDAAFVKICDRLANVKYSFDIEDGKMINVYRNESFEFTKALYQKRYQPMFDEMNIYLTQTPNSCTRQTKRK